MTKPLHGVLPRDWGASPCLDLINSRWHDHVGVDRFYDRLTEPRFRRAFLSRWHYQVANPDDAGAQSHLRSVRRLLRSVLEHYVARRPLSRSMQRRFEAEINRAGVSLRLSDDSGQYALAIRRSGADWDIVTSDIATGAARLMSDRASVKVCANPDCSWMFMDETKARTRRWCNVSVCGSLVNVRRHRALRQG
jgi:predicted RNA-binding Zn ribbon-like protein